MKNPTMSQVLSVWLPVMKHLKFPKPVDKDTIAFWVKIIGDRFTPLEIEAAFEHWSHNHDEFPVPVEITDLARSLRPAKPLIAVTAEDGRIWGVPLDEAANPIKAFDEVAFDAELIEIARARLSNNPSIAAQAPPSTLAKISTHSPIKRTTPV